MKLLTMVLLAWVVGAMIANIGASYGVPVYVLLPVCAIAGIVIGLLR